MNLTEYIGHFHPVLVHLPIGILLTAVLFEWLSHRKGFRKLRKAVGVLLFLGFLSAAFSCLTGYLLSPYGGYDADLLKSHQWLGISVAVVSLGTLLLFRRKAKEVRLAYGVLIFVLAILIGLTGHAGGQLTHGVDFLKPPPLENWFQHGSKEEFLQADLTTAEIYKDLVRPILNRKCITCHGPSKQKGKLRLDDPEFIRKGGKDGSVTMAKSGEESLMFMRIHLGLEDEDHMPPKEKDQLSQKEMLIISFWLKKGTDFTVKLHSLAGGDSIAALLQTREEHKEEKEQKILPAPDPAVINLLRKGGVGVSFLSAGNGYVALSFRNADTTKLSFLIKELPNIRDQILELNLTQRRLAHTDWSVLSALTSMIRLNLSYANITDQDMKDLQALRHVRYLNLVGTNITVTGLEKIKGLSQLKLFLFHSGVHEQEQAAVSRLFPESTIDFGNYKVPTWNADTTLLTKPLYK